MKANVFHGINDIRIEENASAIARRAASAAIVLSQRYTRGERKACAADDDNANEAIQSEATTHSHLPVE